MFFFLYLGAILADQREIWNRDEGSHADVFPVTTTAILANSRWRMAAILKIALFPYSAVNYPITIKFGTQIQIDDESHADRGHVIKNGNFPKFTMADGDHFENGFRCLRHSCNELMLSIVFQ